MKDQDLEPSFSWPLALFVTSISFLAFFYILQKLNEDSPRIFFWVGISCLVLAIIFGIGSLFMKETPRSSHQHHVDQ